MQYSTFSLVHIIVTEKYFRSALDLFTISVLLTTKEYVNVKWDHVEFSWRG
jgi:hypothetical protein